LACPFFFPTCRSQAGAFSHPSRLPLAGGWEGTCTAPGHEGQVPDSFEACNLGYASACPWLPLERKSDAVRFAIAQENEARSLVVYVCEKDHLPTEHGKLEFFIHNGECVNPHSDARIQKMAECFLTSRRVKVEGTFTDLPLGETT
jgi:hypothetical protein